MRKAERSHTHNDSRSGGQLPKDRSTANKRQFEAPSHSDLKVASDLRDFGLEGQESAVEVLLVLV